MNFAKTAKNVGRFFANHQLGCFVVAALIITAVLTLISLHIYISSGAMKLDLSRPGYEKVREEVTQNSAADQPYPSTGALDSAALTDFANRLDEQQKELSASGNFNDISLSDANLGLE